MEYFRIPGVVLKDNSISPLARIIYGVIAKYAWNGKAEFCWASDKHLSAMFEVSQSTISRAVRELKTKEYIEVEQLYDRRGKKGTRKIYPTVDLDAYVVSVVK